MPITVGPFCLTHPVNFPCGRKPEYPEETHDFRQSVDSYSFHMRTGFESHWESSRWDLNLRPQRWKASELTTWPPKPPNINIYNNFYINIYNNFSYINIYNNFWTSKWRVSLRWLDILMHTKSLKGKNRGKQNVMLYEQTRMNINESTYTLHKLSDVAIFPRHLAPLYVLYKHVACQLLTSLLIRNANNVSCAISCFVRYIMFQCAISCFSALYHVLVRYIMFRSLLWFK
jgi:hypothetical protein